MNWYERHPRKVHFDMHSPLHIQNIAKDFDPVAYAKAMKESNADAAVVFAKCAYGWTYFKNDYMPTHPNLMKDDLFGDIKKALDQVGVGTVAYFSTVSMSSELIEQYPDYPGRNSDGQYIRHDMDQEITLCCVNSDYWENHYIPMLVQMVRDNGVSAIWMDGYYQLFNRPCYCEKCRADYDHEIPVDDKDLNWRTYYNYIYGRMLVRLEQIKKAVNAINPECCIGGDWLGSVMWAQDVPDSLDFFSCDVHMTNSSFNTAYASAAWSWRDRPVDIYSERMYWWQDFNSRPVGAVILDQATNVASGGIFMIGDIITPYAMDIHPEKVRYYKEVFDHVNPLFEVSRNHKSIADIALILSGEDARTYGKDWHVRDSKNKGMYSALVEAGYSVHILFESDLQERLGSYKLAVVSEAAYMGRLASSAIKTYVQMGGKLFVSGGLPKVLDGNEVIVDGKDGSREEFEALAGLKYSDVSYESLSFFDVDQTPMANMWGEDFYRLPECVTGYVDGYIATTADVLCHLTAPGDVFQIGARVPGKVTKFSAFSRHDFGQGQVYFAAQPLASNAWDKGHVGSYHAIQTIVGEGLKRPSIIVDGPSTVQLFPMEGGSDLLCNLIAHQSPAQESHARHIMKSSLISGVELVVEGEIKSAYDAVTGEELPINYNSDQTSIKVRPFNIWTSIGVKR